MKPQRRPSVINWLLLTTLAGFLSLGCAKTKSAADYFVSSLPGAPKDVPLRKMHAGHVSVDPEHRGELFFWHFQNQHLADRPRTVIWLNGGPGCSSEDGALMEIGPYRLVDDENLRINNGSWDMFANLLFVDNPVGTGFSVVDSNAYLHELDQMADQFVIFLLRWFEIFPQYQRDDLYFAGESYAGQFIPYIIKKIIERNAKSSPEQRWNLRGAMLGNAWISPTDQYSTHLKYAYRMNLIHPGSEADNIIQRQMAVCLKDLSNGGKDHVSTSSCESILTDILRETRQKSDTECLNMYDVRLRDEYPSCGMAWPPDLKHVAVYLRRQDIRRALNIDRDHTMGWLECSGPVGSAFRPQKSVPSVQLLPEILKEIPLLLYSGDQDLICNHLGTEELINNLEFNGGRGLELSPGVWAPRRTWMFDHKPAGIFQEARNLTYVLIFNASHMVPFDDSRLTRDMLDRFMGVDIGMIGGPPVDSRIDGQTPSALTSVGTHPNSPHAQEAERKRMHEVAARAYYRSGEAALLVIGVAATAWVVFLWYSRAQKRHDSRYLRIPNRNFVRSDREAANGPRYDEDGGRTPKSPRKFDIEAAEFTENELEELEAVDSRGQERHTQQG